MTQEEQYENNPCEYIVEVNDYKIEKNRIIFNCNTNNSIVLNMQVHVLDDDIIRVIGGISSEINQSQFDLVVKKDFNVDSLELDFEKTEKGVCIHTSKLCVKIDFKPWNIEILDKKGVVILSESSNDVNPVGRKRAKSLGTTYSKEDKKILAFNESFVMKQGEHYYGLGEKFTEFDRRGQKVVSWNKDALGVRNELSYKNIPFFMSTAGYGIFVNSGKAVEFDMGHFSSQSLSISVPGDSLDYYFIYGPSFKDILFNYTELTGKAPIPPLWSYGLWMSTGFFGANRNSIEECANEVRKRDIPCDVMHFDCFWLRDNMWCDFQWDVDKYPKTEEMINGMREQGYKICLWINPYVSEKSEMFIEGKSNEYFLKNKDRSVLIGDMWHGEYPACGIIDVTNPGAVEWFKEKLRKLLKMGIDVFKTDFGEEIPVSAYFYNGKTGEEMHNLYSLIYNEIVFEVTNEFKEKPMVWARSGYAGSQRYPVCWSGDPACTFEAMAAVLRGGLSYGMSGVPFWSHDIGGFYGTPSKELYIRWAQFGLFSSHSRCHGTTTREPWVFGKEVEDIFKKYAKLRYKLLPYIYSTGVKCSENALPFIRPLVLMNQNDPTTYHIDDEYYFGDDMIIAPIFSENNNRKIYLPEGNWVDYWSLDVYKGKQWIEYEASLDILPIFVKKQAVIPVLSEDISYINENALDGDIILQVYEEKDKWCEIYRNDEIENITIRFSEEKGEVISDSGKGRYKLQIRSK